MRTALLVSLLLFSAGLSIADSGYLNPTGSHEYYETYEASVYEWLGIAIGILALAVAASVVFYAKLGEMHKRILFIVIVMTVVLFTGFLIVSTIQKNLSSATQGPVHWHADFEVWVCGEKLSLEKSRGIEGRLGSSLLHHHNDNRIHVEGTVMRFEDVSLGEFFRVIGGHFSEDRLKVILDDGSVIEKRNNGPCNGRPGKVQLYVNGRDSKEFGDYIIAPHSNVPPGDFIQIVFDSGEGIPNGG